MEFEAFTKTITGSQPPEDINTYALALWYDAKSDWEKAHTLIQDLEDSTAAWVHAYLHRKEGDTGNARYWYNRAGKKMPGISLEEEWEDIVKNNI